MGPVLVSPELIEQAPPSFLPTQYIAATIATEPVSAWQLLFCFLCCKLRLARSPLAWIRRSDRVENLQVPLRGVIPQCLTLQGPDGWLSTSNQREVLIKQWAMKATIVYSCAILAALRIALTGAAWPHGSESAARRLSLAAELTHTK